MEVFPLQPHKSIGHWGASGSLERWEEIKSWCWYKWEKCQRMSDKGEDERRQDRRRGKENEQIIDQLQCRQRQELAWSVTAAVGALLRASVIRWMEKREWKMIRRAVLEQAVMFSYGEPAARCQQRRMTPQRYTPLITVTSELLSAPVTHCDETEEQVCTCQWEREYVLYGGSY